MSDIVIKSVNGVDIVQYQPMQFRIKDDIIEDAEFIGGCAGNLSGISMLIRGMNINDVIPKLQGIPCGKRPTSCPDQMTLGLRAYIEEKQKVNV